MSSPAFAASPFPPVAWTHHGHHDWTGRGPGGEDLAFAGARSGLFDGRRNSGRGSNVMSLTVQGLRPARLTAESAYDRLAKDVGYAVEPQTGDAEFDGRIYLTTADQHLIAALRERPGLRRAVLDLFDAGAAQVEINFSRVTMTMAGALRPDRDDGQHDMATAGEALCAFVKLWPGPGDGPAPTPSWFDRRIFGLAWALLAGGAIFAAHHDSEQLWARQIETYVQVDWLGMAAWLAVALGPYVLLGARRASSHRTLLVVGLVALCLLPFSKELLQLRANKWLTRAETIVPAQLTDLRQDTDGLHRDGYEAVVVVEDRPTEWELSPQEGRLAAEGRLCVAGVVATGLRDLRYVRTVRTWACRPGQGGKP